MQWLELVGICQSSEENTRGRFKLPGRVGPCRAPVTVEAAEADKTALSFSLYLADTQSSHTNTAWSTAGAQGSQGDLLSYQHKHERWSLKDLSCMLASY